MLKDISFSMQPKKENLKIVTSKKIVNQKCGYYFCATLIANLQQVSSRLYGYMEK